ncbi:hypothetical protein LCGC14_2972430, partial [marine sediment metagenome]
MSTKTEERGLDQEMEDFAFHLRYPSAPERGKRRPKGDSTVGTYVYIVRRFHGFLSGQAPDENMAMAYIRHLEEIGNVPRSRAQAIYGLRAYFEFRGEEFGIGAPSFSKPLPWRPTDDEWIRLLEVAEAPLWDPALPQRAKTRALFHRAALMVYGGAGLRLAEGCAMKKSDLFLAGSDLDPRALLEVKGKGGTVNRIPVEDAVAFAIQEWGASHDSEWVFPGRGGNHIHRRTMQATILALMKKAGIQNVHRAVHALRHTMGAQLRKAGADIRDIQQVLRHADISTTQIYT